MQQSPTAITANAVKSTFSKHSRDHSDANSKDQHGLPPGSSNGHGTPKPNSIDTQIDIDQSTIGGCIRLSITLQQFRKGHSTSFSNSASAHPPFVERLDSGNKPRKQRMLRGVPMDCLPIVRHHECSEIAVTPHRGSVLHASKNP